MCYHDFHTQQTRDRSHQSWSHSMNMNDVSFHFASINHSFKGMNKSFQVFAAGRADIFNSNLFIDLYRTIHSIVGTTNDDDLVLFIRNQGIEFLTMCLYPTLYAGNTSGTCDNNFHFSLFSKFMGCPNNDCIF